MRIILVLCLCLSWNGHANDVLDILDGKQEAGVSSAGVETAPTAKFSKVLRRKNAEQNIFFQFLSREEYQKALYQWPSAFDGKSFATTSSGRALHGYVLFKNGLEVLGIETLFKGSPQKISPILSKAWADLLRDEQEHWAFTNIRWGQGWTKIFGIQAEVKVLARRFDEAMTSKEAERLLRKTNDGTWERAWSQWQLGIALVNEGEDIKGAKILKQLEKSSQKAVSSNLLHITAARILYQNGFLKESIRYYDKISKSSDYWYEAQEEMAWAHLRMGEPQNAMAVTKSLLPKVFRADVGPEAFFLSALSDLKVCDYNEVSDKLKLFKERFQEKAKDLIALQDNPETKDSKKLLGLLQKKRVNTQALGRSGHKLPRYSTRDEYLYYLVQRSHRLAQEAKTAGVLYSQSISQGTAFVGFQGRMERFNNSVQKRASVSRSAAISRLKALSIDETNEISHILKKMQIVEAELIQQLAMSGRVIADSAKKPALQKGTTGSRARDVLRFPGDQEVWFDEISNYKVDIAKGCQASKEI